MRYSWRECFRSILPAIWQTRKSCSNLKVRYRTGMCLELLFLLSTWECRRCGVSKRPSEQPCCSWYQKVDHSPFSRIGSATESWTTAWRLTIHLDWYRSQVCFNRVHTEHKSVMLNSCALVPIIRHTSFMWKHSIPWLCFYQPNYIEPKLQTKIRF